MTHEATRELLPRYIEIERRDGNAKDIYPQAAAHIAECDLCQFTISVIMMDLPGFDAPPDSTLRAADLPFMRQRGRSMHSIRPGSNRQHYSVHIHFPLDLKAEVEAEDDPAEVARSRSEPGLDVPIGGMLLGSHSLTLDDDEIGVTMTLYREVDSSDGEGLSIVADLVGDFSSGEAKAVLMIGSQVYVAPVEGQVVEFWDINLRDEPEQIVLILEN